MTGAGGGGGSSLVPAGGTLTDGANTGQGHATITFAGASLVNLTDGVMSVTGAGDLENVVSIEEAGGTVTVSDAVPLAPVAGSGCVAEDELTVSCAGVSSIEVDLGGGDDVLDAPVGLPVTVDGGAGDDDLVTGSGDDVLDGLVIPIAPRRWR